MQIRAITVGSAVDFPFDSQSIANAGRFAGRVRAAYEAQGVPVQTVRFATQPFPAYFRGKSESEVIRFALELQQCCREHDMDYCSLGPGDPADPEETRLLEFLPHLIAETEVVFASALLGKPTQPISLTTARFSARTMLAIARATAGGFGNLRFAGVINCPPHIPFFPAAFHQGPPAFAIALEAADVIAGAVMPGLEPQEQRVKIRDALETHARPLQDLAQRLAAADFRYCGIDLSPAPGAAPEDSIAYALERFGLGRFGGPGTLTAAATVTAALKDTSLLTCGYCGLMLPVLEDVGLAERNNQGLLRLSSLLSYSAVCGTGLDTIPLPGDVSEEQLTALLLDVATLGWKLGKPLSARFFPIPGKYAGDLTDFDFSYFVNTRVMAIA
jgi:uncharacterized protein (UPF0210 family)